MKTSENGGLLRRLPLFSKLYIISSDKCHFQIFLHSFSSISCFSHLSVSQENRRETTFWGETRGTVSNLASGAYTALAWRALVYALYLAGFVLSSQSKRYCIALPEGIGYTQEGYTCNRCAEEH